MSEKKTKSQYMFVYTLTPVSKGQEFVKWPLHITILPWFVLKDQSCNSFLDEIIHIAKMNKPFTIRVGRQQRWGWHKVNRIEFSKELTSLHKELLRIINTTGGFAAPLAFVGNKYIPHVTHKSYIDSIKKGHNIMIDKISLIETNKVLNSRNHAKRVLANLTLREK